VLPHRVSIAVSICLTKGLVGLVVYALHLICLRARQSTAVLTICTFLRVGLRLAVLAVQTFVLLLFVLLRADYVLNNRFYVDVRLFVNPVLLIFLLLQRRFESLILWFFHRLNGRRHLFIKLLIVYWDIHIKSVAKVTRYVLQIFLDFERIN